MTTKKVLAIIVGGTLLVGLLFVGALYLSLRTKVEDVSKEAPFNQFTFKNLILANDATLVNNYEHFVYEEPLLLNAVGEQLYEGTSIAHYLKQGDTLFIKSAKYFTSGVSGTTHPIVIGEVLQGKDAAIPFEYYWDTQEIIAAPDGALLLSFTIPSWQQEQEAMPD